MATIDEVRRAAEEWERDRQARLREARKAARTNYTRRAENRIARGLHPLAERPLAGNGETCGSCACSVRVGHGRKDYWKCDAEGGRLNTHSEATDLRLRWPACILWRPRLPVLPPSGMVGEPEA